VETPYNQLQTAPPGPAKFDPGRFVVWLALCLVSGWLLGWLAAQIGRHFAPLVLFPLLEGLALGIVTILWLRNCNQGNRPATVVGLVLTAMLFFVAQHYASFRAAQAAAEKHQQDVVNAVDDKQKFAVVAAQLAPPPPANLQEYLQAESQKGRPLFKNVTARGGWAWASWAFDGLLLLAAAGLVVVPAAKQPYCNTCHSWYHVVRAAPIPGNIENAIRSACCFADEPTHRVRRFVLLSCQGGCGPDAMDLIRESNGKGPAPLQTRIWLTIAQRQAVTAILDQPSARGGTES
jgi:hypothetical protein